jgi:predicted ATPase
LDQADEDWKEKNKARIENIRRKATEKTRSKSRHQALLQQSQESYEMMNPEQRSVSDRVLNSTGMGGCYFLDGKAGRGKTFLVNAVRNRIRGEGRIA